MPYNVSMYSFIETKLFSRLIGEYLSDEEYASLQRALIVNPELRWALPGRGKRGGVRVIYYAKTRERVIWMLTIYAKNVAENIPAHVLRKIKEGIDG